MSNEQSTDDVDARSIQLLTQAIGELSDRLRLAEDQLAKTHRIAVKAFRAAAKNAPESGAASGAPADDVDNNAVTLENNTVENNTIEDHVIEVAEDDDVEIDDVVEVEVDAIHQTDKEPPSGSPEQGGSRRVAEPQMERTPPPPMRSEDDRLAAREAAQPPTPPSPPDMAPPDTAPPAAPMAAPAHPLQASPPPASPPPANPLSANPLSANPLPASPLQASPLPAGPVLSVSDTAWESMLLGDLLTRAEGVVSDRNALLSGLHCGEPAAGVLVGLLMVFRNSTPERMAQLLKDIGEAYYSWRPGTSSHDLFRQTLIESLHRECENAGVMNRIELVTPGDRFDSARHHSKRRGGMEVAEVQGWVVLRENGKPYTKAHVTVR